METEDEDEADAEEIYTLGFCAEAVKLLELEVLSVDAAVKRLSVPKSSIGNWVLASRAGKLASVGQGQSDVATCCVAPGCYV